MCQSTDRPRTTVEIDRDFVYGPKAVCPTEFDALDMLYDQSLDGKLPIAVCAPEKEVRKKPIKKATPLAFKSRFQCMRQQRFVMRHKKTGRTGAFFLDCDSWACQACADRRRLEIGDHFIQELMKWNECWIVEVDNSRRKAVRQAAKKIGSESYVCLRTDEHRVVYFFAKKVIGSRKVRRDRIHNVFRTFSSQLRQFKQPKKHDHDRPRSLNAYSSSHDVAMPGREGESEWEITPNQIISGISERQISECVNSLGVEVKYEVDRHGRTVALTFEIPGASPTDSLSEHSITSAWLRELQKRLRLVSNSNLLEQEHLTPTLRGLKREESSQQAEKVVVNNISDWRECCNACGNELKRAG